MYKDLMQLHSNQKILIFEMLKRGIDVELLNRDLLPYREGIKRILKNWGK